MAMRPTMIRLGRTTPAIHGSKYTSISWRPRKYQGAFDGFGVLFGLAGSSSGASIAIDHTVITVMTMSDVRNSRRTRYGQVWMRLGRATSLAFALAFVPASSAAGAATASSAIVRLPYSGPEIPPS